MMPMEPWWTHGITLGLVRECFPGTMTLMFIEIYIELVELVLCLWMFMIVYSQRKETSTIMLKQRCWWFLAEWIWDGWKWYDGLNIRSLCNWFQSPYIISLPFTLIECTWICAGSWNDSHLLCGNNSLSNKSTSPKWCISWRGIRCRPQSAFHGFSFWLRMFVLPRRDWNFGRIAILPTPEIKRNMFPKEMSSINIFVLLLSMFSNS